MKLKSAATGLAFIVWALSIPFVPNLQSATHTQVQQKTNAQISPADKQAIAAFETRVKDYVKLRNQVKDKLPKLSKDSTPEQIESYRKSFEEGMRAAARGS